MRAQEFTNAEESKERFKEMFARFLPLAMKYLELERLPKIIFKKHVESTGQPTFGMYVNGENTLYVALVNRHPNDILRTVAHELTHYKQDTEHKLNDQSGTTGSPEENEAHAMAGIVMRHFNKQYPEYLNDRPVIAEDWSEKYKRSINCANPKGFSQRAHCQGRKKHEDANNTIEGIGDKPTDPGPQEFVSNKFLVKFTNDALLIFDSGELVYKKPGNYSNPTRQDASLAKSLTTWLWQRKHNPFGRDTSKNSIYLIIKPEDIHRIADEKGIPWDNNRKFLNLSKKLTGKSHLDNMTPEELRIVFDYLSKIKIKENFADGRHPEDKGDSKRYGVPTKASVSTLRKVAKQGGRKGQLAHWMANMKAGKAKKH